MPAEGDTHVPPEPESEMGSRARTTSLLLIGGGAALVFLAFGQPWTTARLVDPGLPLLYRDITGRELAPVVGVLPVLLFAAVLALIATVGTVRRVLGGIVCVIAGVLLLTSLRGAPPYIGTSLADFLGLPQEPPNDATAWWLIAVLASAAALCGGVMAAAGAHKWPVMSDRYERGPKDDALGLDNTAVTGALRADEALQSQDLQATSRQTWDSLDRGDDPTWQDESDLRPRRDHDND